MDQKYVEALLAANGVIDQDDVELLIAGERAGYGDGSIVNWKTSDYREVLEGNAAKAYVVEDIVSRMKVGDAPEVGKRTAVPDFPPYLEVGPDRKPKGYNPHDASQFWTDPASGELWRWDGKGRGIQTGMSQITKETIPPPPFPNGEPHRVAVVRHVTFDGVLIPDPQEAHDANAAEMDWFHRGYGCWIGNGGKPYGEVDPEVRRRLISAQQRSPLTEQVLVRRQPSTIGV